MIIKYCIGTKLIQPLQGCLLMVYRTPAVSPPAIEIKAFQALAYVYSLDVNLLNIKR